MTEAITLLESQSANSKNANADTGLSIMSAPIVGLDEILAKMDNTEDPFERMYIVMSELMPAITQWKEDELEELSGGLEELSEMTETVATIQDALNRLQETNDAEAATTYQLETENLITQITESHYLEDGNAPTPPPPPGQERPLPPPAQPGSLKAQLLDAATALKDLYKGYGGGTGEPGDRGPQDFANNVNTTWNGFNSWNKTGNGGEENDPTNLTSVKPFIDELNKLGTGLKNTSGVVQARFQFEVGNYETYIGVYKDMFKNWKNQLQSPLDGIKRAG